MTTTTETRGIHADIYRADYNSRLNVFGKVKRVTLVGIRDARNCHPSDAPVTPIHKSSHAFKPSDDAPAAVIVFRRSAFIEKGRAGVIAHVEPLQPGDRPWYMAGGSYVATTDSRFSEAIESFTGVAWHGALSLHDRVED